MAAAMAETRPRIPIQYLAILGATLLMAVMAGGFGWLNYHGTQSLLLDASAGVIQIGGQLIVGMCPNLGYQCRLL